LRIAHIGSLVIELNECAKRALEVALTKVTNYSVGALLMSSLL